VAISLGREKIGEQFSHGYIEETTKVEEPEIEEDDPLEISAGRGGEVGAKRYGVSLDVIKHLSSRSIDTFRPLSQKWHEFLGLASSRSRGQKRGMQSSSDSGSVYIQLQVPGWRADASMANNGVRGWGAAIGMLREQGIGQGCTEDGSNGN
jgi:hypothetical protein